MVFSCRFSWMVLIDLWIALEFAFIASPFLSSAILPALAFDVVQPAFPLEVWVLGGAEVGEGMNSFLVKQDVSHWMRVVPLDVVSQRNELFLGHAFCVGVQLSALLTSP